MYSTEYTPCPTHGTFSAYTNKRCRCDVCRRNNTLRSRGFTSTQRAADLKELREENEKIQERLSKVEATLYRLAIKEEAS